MKKNICLIITVLFIGIACISIISCSRDLIIDEESELTEKNIEIKKFLLSEDYKTFLQKSNLKEENIKIHDVHVQSFEHNHVNVFTVPIEKKNKLHGKLIIYSKHNGKKFYALYEDWNNVNLLNEGNITIQNLDERYIATINLVRKEDNGYLAQITDVAQVLQTPRLRSDAIEWPTSDDGWWDCTTRCFKIAKDACGDDPQCNFLCEIADLAAGCTITTAVACGIYCL